MLVGEKWEDEIVEGEVDRRREEGVGRNPALLENTI